MNTPSTCRRWGWGMGLTAIVGTVVAAGLLTAVLRGRAPRPAARNTLPLSGSTPTRSLTREPADRSSAVNEPTSAPVSTASQRSHNGKPAPEAAQPRMTAETLQAEAMAVVVRLVDDCPRSTDALGLLGMVHNRYGNTAEAVKCWQRCVEIDPNRADAYRSIGEVAARKGEYDEAVRQFRKALEVDPKAPGIHAALADALMTLGEVAEAITVLERGTKALPTANDINFTLAQAYLQIQEYGLAKTDYEAVIAVRPDMAGAYHGLAVACGRLGLAEQARQYQEEFLRLKGEERKTQEGRRYKFQGLILDREGLAEILTDAGCVYFGNGKPEPAEELWLRAAFLDRQNARCRTQLAFLYRQQHRDGDALRMLDQVREAEPENAVNLLAVGLLCQKLNRSRDAEDAFRGVIKLAPGRGEGSRALAELYLQTDKNLAEARDLAARAVALQPSASNYSILSQVCYKNGDLSASLSAAQEAVRRDPGNATYRQLAEFVKSRPSRK